MAQHDFSIANQGFPAFRADLNDAWGAIASTSSGASAPSVTYANQLWMDTTNHILKVRNEDNDAWINIATFDQTTDAVTYIDGLEIAKVIVSDAEQTFTAKQTFSGSSSVASMKTSNIAEVDTIAATAATGVINYDVATQSVLFYTTDASGNWTVNFRGSSGTSLDALMATGESISVTFLVTQGATAYYNSAVTVDGSSVTPKWQGGSAPTSGNASSVDCYTYVIQKTGSATYVVLASQTQFA